MLRGGHRNVCDESSVSGETGSGEEGKTDVQREMKLQSDLGAVQIVTRDLANPLQPVQHGAAVDTQDRGVAIDHTHERLS